MVLSLLLYSLLVMAVAAIALAIFPLRPIRRAWALLMLAAACVGIAAILSWPPPMDRTARGKLLIDLALPRYQFAERHQTRICAPPERIAAALKQVQPNEIRWLGLLSSIRGLPSHGEGRPMLDGALESLFVLLADTPTELLLGAAGEFWRLEPMRKSLDQVTGDPTAFAALDLGGKPKAIFNFAIDPAPLGCKTVTTETRIYVAGPEMQRKFAAYWRVVQPGSALLRRTWLDAIRRRAEEIR